MPGLPGRSGPEGTAGKNGETGQPGSPGEDVSLMRIKMLNMHLCSGLSSCVLCEIYCTSLHRFVCVFFCRAQKVMRERRAVKGSWVSG